MLENNKYIYGKFELRPYQAEAYEKIAQYIKGLPAEWQDSEALTGAFVEASVGAGKTAIMGAVGHRFAEIGWPVLCLARDLKLVEQNSKTFWRMGPVFNSIYSAAYSKTMVYAEEGMIVSNEATAYRAIYGSKKQTEEETPKPIGKAWENYAPKVLLLDECHQASVDRNDSQYMLILKALNDRCLEKYGHPIILIGFTGSPYRHTTSIIGDVWKESLYSIDTATLVGMGFLVPTIFGAEVGHDKSLNYDMKKYAIKSDVGTQDYSAKELAAMERELVKDKDKLKNICDEVIRLAKYRNAVMITCAGVKHCKEVSKYLPDGEWVIVHSNQSKRVNDANLDLIANGKAKYLLQVGCLTTGYDEPIIDTSVILRRIGSLTLLVQLLGRGMRLLTSEHEEAGYSKKDHLVLDYSGTMDEMSELYENPILDECRAKESIARKDPTMECPICGTLNHETAARCVGRDRAGNRCEYFFRFIQCVDRRAPNGKILSKGCGAYNDTRSKTCRVCGEWLNDPSGSLNGEHYHENDLIEVKKFSFGLTRAGDKLIAQYVLANGAKPREIFDIKNKEKWRRASWYAFLKSHVVNKITINKLFKCYDPTKAMNYLHEIRKPEKVTHRVNSKGFDILARKEFKD